MVRRPGPPADLHLRRHEPVQQHDRQPAPPERGEAGGYGDGHPQAPLPVLVHHPGPAQDRGGDHPRHQPSHQKGRGLPGQRRPGLGHRLHRRRGGLPGGGGRGAGILRSGAEVPGPRRPGGLAGLRPGAGKLLPGPGAHPQQGQRPYASLLQFRHNRLPQDGDPRPQLRHRPHRHRPPLAQRGPRRAAPDGGGHRLGQGGVGQAVRPVALRGGGVRLRLHQVRPQGPAAKDPAVPDHHLLRPPHHLPVLHQGGGQRGGARLHRRGGGDRHPGRRPHPRPADGILPGPGADQGGVARRLVPHRGHSVAGRGRLLLVCWPHRRRHQGLRLPHRPL